MTDTPAKGGSEGAWTKLRRRKVVQWGVAYAAGAWGVLQGLAYLSDTFDWPRQIQQFGTLALLIGLPDRPRHRLVPRRSWPAALVGS